MFTSDHSIVVATRRSARAAFTLLEILIVLALVGLLVGLAVSKLGGILGGGQEDVARIFVNSSIKLPLNAYRLHVGNYPTSSEGLQALISAPASRAERWRGPYLEKNELPLDPWNNPYHYAYPGSHNKDGYDVWSSGPDAQDGTPDDIGNWGK